MSEDQNNRMPNEDVQPYTLDEIMDLLPTLDKDDLEWLKEEVAKRLRDGEGNDDASG